MAEVNTNEVKPEDIQRHFETYLDANFEILTSHKSSTYVHDVYFQGLKINIFILKRGQIITVVFEH